jgi:hypothetical protein
MGEFVKNEDGIYVSGQSQKIDYPDEGHEDSLAFEEQSFWFTHRNQVILEVLQKIKLSSNFVDIGAGNGLQAAFLQRAFPEKKVAMIEPGYFGCLTGVKRGVQYVYNGFFQDFDFRSFDASAVGLFDVVEHIEKDDEFLNTLAGKLRSGDKIVITVPAYNWLWSELDDYGSHYRRYNKKMIYDLAQRSGLHVRYFSYFFSYLVPLTFLLRTIPYKIRGSRSKEAILATENQHHKPNPIIQKVFSFLGKLEMAFIKKSSCKFGASIIVAFEIP